MEITLNDFLDGYRDGSITEVVIFKNVAYGKQIRYSSNIPSSERPEYRIVSTSLP